MKRNLVGKMLGKIKIFVQDFVPIRTALSIKLEVLHSFFFYFKEIGQFENIMQKIELSAL